MCGLFGLDTTWEHCWECCLHQPPPYDILLWRFLWPRNKGDISLCCTFEGYGSKTFALEKLFDEFGAVCSFCIQDFKVRIVAAMTPHSKNSLLGAAAGCHVLLAGVYS